MGRFEPYSRRELRRRRRAWVRRNLGAVAVVILGMTAIIGLVTACVLLGMRGPVRWYALGFFQATAVAAGIHLLNTAFLAHDQSALSQVRGAWGEENTRSELQRAKRRRLIWGWIDSIGLEIGDLDHVVITRRGGLLAVDSKWRNEVRNDDPAALARQAIRAKTRAEGVARTVLRAERGARHRARLRSVSVRPVVVLWGAAQHTVPNGVAVVDGVTFLAGRKLLPWLKSLEGEPVPKDAALDALQRLKDYRSKSGNDLRANREGRRQLRR